MMIKFGQGQPLTETSPWLRNRVARIERILTVVETNSVIEGLPAFSDEMRARLRVRLISLAVPAPGHGE